MKILAIYKYYWPDTTPYARILKGILEKWVEDGHDAQVITAQPGYNDIRHPRQPDYEVLGGVGVRRLRIVREVKRSSVLRALSFVTFLSQALFRACTGPRADMIIVNPHPPVLMGLTVRLIKLLRGIPYVYHCEDIHPESALAAGTLNKGWLYRLLLRFDTASCRHATLIVTLSRDMVGTLLARGVDENRICVINNYILGTEEAPASGESVIVRQFGDHESVFVLLFAGNIGLYQGLDHFIHTARLLRHRPEIKFVFMGEGAAKEGLKRLAGDMVEQTVYFAPFQPLPVARQAMAEADLALVSLARGVFRVAYPSKTMNCLAAGSPVLAIVESESVLAGEIREHQLGFCCVQGDHEATAAAIAEACDDRVAWRQERARIAGWAESHFGRQRILGAWSEIPGKVAAWQTKD